VYYYAYMTVLSRGLVSRQSLPSRRPANALEAGRRPRPLAEIAKRGREIEASTSPVSGDVHQRAAVTVTRKDFVRPNWVERCEGG